MKEKEKCVWLICVSSCVTTHIGKYWRKERFENQEFIRSDSPSCPFNLLGLQARWHSVLESCRTDILTVLFFWKSFCLKMSLPQWPSLWKCCHYSILTQRLHYVTEPFAPSPLIQFSDTVETRNTWECALRQSWEAAWMENCSLIIADGELAYPNPYRAKLFPPLASFITARTLVHWCFTSCSLCYFSRNNDLWGWTFPLGKLGNCLESTVKRGP